MKLIIAILRDIDHDAVFAGANFSRFSGHIDCLLRGVLAARQHNPARRLRRRTGRARVGTGAPECFSGYRTGHSPCDNLRLKS